MRDYSLAPHETENDATELDQIIRSIRAIERYTERLEAGEPYDPDTKEQHAILINAELLLIRSNVNRLFTDRDWLVDQCHTKNIQIEALRSSQSRLIRERESRPLNRIKSLLYRCGILNPYHPGH